MKYGGTRLLRLHGGGGRGSQRIIGYCVGPHEISIPNNRTSFLSLTQVHNSGEKGDLAKERGGKRKGQLKFKRGNKQLLLLKESATWG